MVFRDRRLFLDDRARREDERRARVARGRRGALLVLVADVRAREHEQRDGELAEREALVRGGRRGAREGARDRRRGRQREGPGGERGVGLGRVAARLLARGARRAVGRGGRAPGRNTLAVGGFPVDTTVRLRRAHFRERGHVGGEMRASASGTFCVFR